MTHFGTPIPFLPIFVVAQLLVFGSVALIGAYVAKYGGKLNWETNPGNYHPLFMTIGLIFCYAQGMLVFRFLRHLQKPTLKIFHAILMGTAFIFVVVGVHSEFKEKENYKAHTLHAWLGLGTVTLFACQLLCGFLTFLLPFAQLRMRQFYLPIHVFFGVGIFCMAVGTALMGVTEKLMWAGMYTNSLGLFQTNTTLLKCFALSLVLLAMTLVYAVANPKFKRQPLSEELIVSNGFGINADDKIEAQVY